MKSGIDGKQTRKLIDTDRENEICLYIYVYARLPPRSASFEQMTSASFVVVDIVDRERERERTKRLSTLNFTFRSFFFLMACINLY